MIIIIVVVVVVVGLRVVNVDSVQVDFDDGIFISVGGRPGGWHI